MAKVYVGLYLEHIANLRPALKSIQEDGFDLMVGPIVNPLYYRNFDDDRLRAKSAVFSRSDLIMEAGEWHHRHIARISDDIDCDSTSATVRRHSQQVLQQELSFAEHLNTQVMIRIKSKARTTNLANIVSRQIKSYVLVEVPMVDPLTVQQCWRADADIEVASSSPEDTWTWWNRFRSGADFDSKIGLALEMSADIPCEAELQRWLGEPVAQLIVPSHVFIRNSQNYAVLSRAHQAVVVAFMRNNVGFLVKSNRNDGSLSQYSDYIRHLCNVHYKKDPMQGFDDFLEIPLQPLYDNLDSYTYEVFEKDPVKYLHYQRAIERALVDKVPETEIASKTMVLMVVGAGRGPLVRAAFNAAANTNRTIKVYVIEKNPNAINTLTALIAEMWLDKDLQLISCDMRDFTPPEKVDILVSELLGSFGDNELSPECLDGAQKHLKPDGISIPSRSTSYLNPVMSSKIYNLVRTIDKGRHPRDKPHYTSEQSELTYVIYLKNVFHIADPQPVFVFDHPNRDAQIDNSRYETLRFTATMDSVMHGLAGYFDTVLYKDVMLSTHPVTHTAGLASWFAVFFPVSEPMQLKAGDTVEINMWRCLSSSKVWYEWSVTEPTLTHVHNHNGRHGFIYK